MYVRYFLSETRWVRFYLYCIQAIEENSRLNCRPTYRRLDSQRNSLQKRSNEKRMNKIPSRLATLPDLLLQLLLRRQRRIRVDIPNMTSHVEAYAKILVLVLAQKTINVFIYLATRASQLRADRVVFGHFSECP
jgi:hypothetical protein